MTLKDKGKQEGLWFLGFGNFVSKLLPVFPGKKRKPLLRFQFRFLSFLVSAPKGGNRK